jgi:hypothetical protein
MVVIIRIPSEKPICPTGLVDVRYWGSRGKNVNSWINFKGPPRRQERTITKKD